MRCITCRAVNAGNRARINATSPPLACGAYALRVSLADATMDNHTQRHRLHDVAIFELPSTSAIHLLVGLPITPSSPLNARRLDDREETMPTLRVHARSAKNQHILV